MCAWRQDVEAQRLLRVGERALARLAAQGVLPSAALLLDHAQDLLACGRAAEAARVCELPHAPCAKVAKAARDEAEPAETALAMLRLHIAAGADDAAADDVQRAFEASSAGQAHPLPSYVHKEAHPSPCILTKGSALRPRARARPCAAPLPLALGSRLL